jgi:hypothetical protein
VEVHERGQGLLLAAGRAHDGQFQVAVIDMHRLLADLNCRQGYVGGGLGTRQCGAGFGRRQAVERLAALKGLQEFCYVVFDAGPFGCRGTTKRQGHDGKGESGGERFHDASLLSPECVRH